VSITSPEDGAAGGLDSRRRMKLGPISAATRPKAIMMRNGTTWASAHRLNTTSCYTTARIACYAPARSRPREFGVRRGWGEGQDDAGTCRHRLAGQPPLARQPVTESPKANPISRRPLVVPELPTVTGHEPQALHLPEEFGDEPRPGAERGWRRGCPTYCQLSRPGNV